MVHEKQTGRERNGIEPSQDAGLEPISARSEEEAGEHLGQVANPLQGPHTHTYRLICLPLDCGRKPKYLEDTHTDKERKYKLVPHRKVPTRNLNTCCCEVL
uniref:Uncharacterized protein n=1 Tax=Anguilla anguilla TaxID=7936 RepID=A0A0E9XQD1_ANGAN